MNDTNLKNELSKLIAKLSRVAPTPAQQLKKILDKQFEKYREKKSLIGIEPIQNDLTLSWLNMDETIVAQQMSLYEFNIFASVATKETLNLNWSKRKELAPNVLALIDQFNKVIIIDI